MSESCARVSVELPGHRAPAAGYEAPFQILHACHERVQRTLSLLQRLQAHVVQQGADVQAVQAARDIVRYFEQAAPQHHLDEERHVFPRVLALGDPVLTQTVHRLQRDHVEMETTWAQVRVELQHLIDTKEHVDEAWSTRSRDLFSHFLHLYERHIPDEEQLVFPAGERSMEPVALTVMAQDMMQRRGVRLD
jgi:hemerythrin-like domain-containing protein